MSLHLHFHLIAHLFAACGGHLLFQSISISCTCHDGSDTSGRGGTVLIECVTGERTEQVTDRTFCLSLTYHYCAVVQCGQGQSCAPGIAPASPPLSGLVDPLHSCHLLQLHLSRGSSGEAGHSPQVHSFEGSKSQLRTAITRVSTALEQQSLM